MDLEYGPEYEAFRRRGAELPGVAPREGARALLGRRPGARRRRCWPGSGCCSSAATPRARSRRSTAAIGAAPDLLARIILDEEFARAGMPPGIGDQGPDMLVPTLLELGSEEQKRALRPADPAR